MGVGVSGFGVFGFRFWGFRPSELLGLCFRRALRALGGITLPEFRL